MHARPPLNELTSALLASFLPRIAAQDYGSYAFGKVLKSHRASAVVPAVRTALQQALEAGRPTAASVDETLLRPTLMAARLILRCQHLPSELASLAQQVVQYAWRAMRGGVAWVWT